MNNSRNNRIPLVAGNWKMHGSRQTVHELLQNIKNSALGVDDVLCSENTTTQNTVELAVLPPFIYLPEVAESLAGSSIRWGAQNLSEHQSGAYTGEVAAVMLRDFGCTYVLVGHSERRTLYSEDNAVVAAKFVVAQKHQLQPILCVGETLEQREQGETHAESVIARQLNAVLDLIDVRDFAQSVIAYEPVWAIGTGKTATPQQAQAMHAFIRGMITTHDATIAASIRILYGGSVKSSNAVDLFMMPDIDGGLIGGASLQADDFLAIAAAAKML